MATIEIGEIELSNGAARISYASETGLDISQDSAVGEVQKALANSFVVAAVARVGFSGRQIRCNFLTGIGSGHRSSRFYVSELLTKAMPLLFPVTGAELETLKSVVDSGHASHDDGAE